MCPEWTWRVSGWDGRRHAFPADGGYVAADSVFAIWQCAADGRSFAHQVEVFRTACDAEVPIAVLMPHDQGLTCPHCEHRAPGLKAVVKAVA